MTKIDKDHILNNLDKPEALEGLYHKDPESFSESIIPIAEENPNSPLLQFWKIRLEYLTKSLSLEKVSIWVVLLIALINGLFIRVPEFWLLDEWFYPRFLPFFMILAVATYFLYRDKNKNIIKYISGFSFLTIIYLTFLPDIETSDSVTMALLHLPFTMLTVLFISFGNGDWKNNSIRLDFIRFCGELLILTTLILIGGGVFTAIVMGLFELLQVMDNFEEWYLNNVGLIGVSSAPLIAAYIYDSVLNRKVSIMEILARIFAPLFCALIFVYLATMLYLGNNPFVNRDFLMVFNVLLILVLGILIFSIVNRRAGAKFGVGDWINILMVIGALFINVLALSAILFRLAEYGWSPNRFYMLGINTLVFIHLAIIGFTYVKTIKGQADFSTIREKVAGYLPLYAGWFILVTYLMPGIFGFD